MLDTMHERSIMKVDKVIKERVYMILFTQFVVSLAVATIIVAGIAGLIDNWKASRLRRIKYYTVESNDGQVYMTYTTRKQAAAEATAFAYSGTCYEHTVGNPNRRKVAFVW